MGVLEPALEAFMWLEARPSCKTLKDWCPNVIGVEQRGLRHSQRTSRPKNACKLQEGSALVRNLTHDVGHEYGIESAASERKTRPVAANEGWGRRAQARAKCLEKLELQVEAYQAAVRLDLLRGCSSQVAPAGPTSSTRIPGARPCRSAAVSGLNVRLRNFVRRMKSKIRGIGAGTSRRQATMANRVATVHAVEMRTVLMPGLPSANAWLGGAFWMRPHLRGGRPPRDFRGAAAMQPVDADRPLRGRML